MAHGGETNDSKILFTINDEKIDDLLRNSNLNYQFMDDDGYLLSFSDYEKFKVMVSDKGYDDENIFVSDYDYANGGFIENTYEVFYYDADGEKHISKPIKANSEEEAISKFENDSPQLDVSYAKKIMADGGFVNKTDEELKAMSDDELFAYLDAKAAYMKQYIRPLSAYKAKNFAATSKAIELKNEGTSKLDENFVDIKKINEQASKDADDYLSSKMALGGMIPGRYYKDNKGEEYRFVGENRGKLLFKDGEKVIEKSEDDFEDDYPKESKLFGFFKDGGELAKQKFDTSDSEAAEDVFEWLIDNISEEI
jgi:shikimate kinase